MCCLSWTEITAEQLSTDVYMCSFICFYVVHSVGKDQAPETMVNLEVWIKAGFNIEEWVAGHKLVNGGPLGPSGRLASLITLMAMFLINIEYS